MYESKDIKKSTNCFISMKDFLKFCSDFNIVPYLCKNNQIIKVNNFLFIFVLLTK